VVVRTKVENFYSMMHPDDVEQAVNIILDSFQENTEFNTKFRLRHKDGYYIWFASHGNIIKDEKQHISRMTGFGRLIGREKN